MMTWPNGMTGKQVYKGRTVTEYELQNVPDGWTDYEIINACDKGNFGGRVVRTRQTKFAKVYVYTD